MCREKFATRRVYRPRAENTLMCCRSCFRVFLCKFTIGTQVNIHIHEKPFDALNGEKEEEDAKRGRRGRKKEEKKEGQWVQQVEERKKKKEKESFSLFLSMNKRE